MLCASHRSCKYQFHSFWIDPTTARTHNLQHLKKHITITPPMQFWILNKKELIKCFWRPTHNRSFMQSFSSNGPVMFVESIEMWKVVLNFRLRKKNLCLNHSTSSKKNVWSAVVSWIRIVISKKICPFTSFGSFSWSSSYTTLISD